MTKKGLLILPQKKCLIGLDAEWTKNYKIKNGNVPFCFSVVSVNIDDISFEHLISGTLKFSYIQFYCDNSLDCKELILIFEDIVKKINDSLETCVLCGHQLSSDLSVFLNYGQYISLSELHSIEKMQDFWHKRRSTDHISIFDSRYDISQVFLGSSRRLVDMCNDFHLDVTQPELGNCSMTKLHKDYLTNGDSLIRERIGVMNIRHSLCATILYWLNLQISQGASLHNININRTIEKNLSKDFTWIQSNKFKELLKR